MTRKTRLAPHYALLDARQRTAAAFVLAAVQLPAQMNLISRLFLQVEQLLPGCTVDTLHIGDRLKALQSARTILDELIAET
jgi:hypothetical protein